MINDAFIIQDLMDIVHINHERVAGYTRAAYSCENIQLKMLLNKEADQMYDSILAVKGVLSERFDIAFEFEAKGPLFEMWTAFKPSLYGKDMSAQLLDFELAGLLTLQCYCFVIQRSYIDTISKALLEFQYQSNLVSYYNMKVFRGAQKSKQATFYPHQQSA